MESDYDYWWYRPIKEIKYSTNRNYHCKPKHLIVY